MRSAAARGVWQGVQTDTIREVARNARANAASWYQAARVRLRAAALRAWRTDTAEVARRTLWSYAHSLLPLVEAGIVLAIFALAFAYPVGAAHFFDTAGLALALWAVPAVDVLTHSTARTGALDDVERRSALRGLALAASLTRVGPFALLLALTLITQRLPGAPGGMLVAGTLGLLVNCAVVATLTIAFGALFASRSRRFGLIVWLDLALVSYQASGALGAVLAVLRLPLLPFAACYAFGATGVVGLSGLWALLMQAGLIAGLLWVAEHTPPIQAPAAEPAAEQEAEA